MAESLLTDQELQALSDDLAFARPDVCHIFKPVETRDVGGAVQKTWQETTGSPVGCRVEAQNRVMQESLVGGKITPVVNYLVNLPRGTEVGPDYRIVKDGVTLEIGGVPGLETFYAEIRVPAVATDDTVF